MYSDETGANVPLSIQRALKSTTLYLAFSISHADLGTRYSLCSSTGMHRLDRIQENITHFCSSRTRRNDFGNGEEWGGGRGAQADHGHQRPTKKNN